METVIKSILAALEKNGFPEKKVSLPFQAIFKSCKNHDTTLSNVLNHLKTSDILHETTGDRILFYHKTLSPSKKEAAGPDPDKESGTAEKAYAEAMEKLQQMDPQEVERLKKQVMDMSPEEQAELMKKAQSMFQKEKK
jgi:chorismate mutase